MQTSAVIRLIRADELPTLLSLYRYLHPEDPELPITGDLAELWQRIQSDPHLLYFVGDVDGRVVSTCNLTIIPNLTRGARSRMASSRMW